MNTDVKQISITAYSHQYESMCFPTSDIQDSDSQLMRYAMSGIVSVLVKSTFSGLHVLFAIELLPCL